MPGPVATRPHQTIMATRAAGAVDLHGAVLNEGTTPEADSPGPEMGIRATVGGMKGAIARS